MSQRSLASDLASLLETPAQVLSDPEELQLYAYDAGLHSFIHPQLPEAVVLPRTTREVAAVIRYARERRIPVTPRGGASGQAGGCLASPGGIIIDSAAMNRVLEVDTDGLMAWAQSGISHSALNDHLAQYDLYLPPDPSSGRACTIGGMIANNSSGPRSLKYGPISHYVFGLEVVLPSGEVIVTGGANSRTRKTASGLNLPQLFVGSGGTLGFITAARLRLMPRPAASAAVLTAFLDMDDGWKMVRAIRKAGVLPSSMEFEYPAPGTTSAAAEFRPDFHLPEAELVIIIEMEGNEGSVRHELEQVLPLARELAQKVEWADDAHGVHELWEGLDSIEGLTSQTRPGARRIPGGEDISVPWVRMGETLRGLKAIVERYGIGGVHFGHAMEGNIHTGLLVKLEDPDDVARAEAATREIHQLALDMGGSVTGEHGIGTARLEYMVPEHGASYELMAAIKRTIDPDNIMNPGKVFPVIGDE